MEPRPIVSVIVLTYNSAAFVKETLDSIHRQTYPSIELIVSDDCSGDDTLAICSQWLGENGDRFVRAEILTGGRNGGIAVNANRGVAVSSGAWIKLVAGDDVLLDNCIADLIGFTVRNRQAQVIFSSIYYIDDSSQRIGEFPARSDFYADAADRQLEKLVYANLLPACAAFLNKDVLVKEGGYDPAYHMMEDYPLWIKLSSRKYKIEYLEEFTVSYRIHDGMTSNNWGKINRQYLVNLKDFSVRVRLPLAKRISPRVMFKVRRDILLMKLRLYFPFGYKALVPVLWWGWTRFKKLRYGS